MEPGSSKTVWKYCVHKLPRKGEALNTTPVFCSQNTLDSGVFLFLFVVIVVVLSETRNFLKSF